MSPLSSSLPPSQLSSLPSSLPALIEQLKNAHADFDEVLAFISAHFHYTPTRFYNGVGDDVLINDAGKNEGSCRVFALAQLHGVSEADTLLLFGRFYRDDVLQNPQGNDHGNIRHFMRHGWAGIRFDGAALRARDI